MRGANGFSGYPLDKAGHRRRDQAWLEAAQAQPGARIIGFSGLKPLLRRDSGASPVAAIAWLDPAQARGFPADGPALFLGVEPGGAAVFAVASPGAEPPEAVAAFAEPQDLRSVAPRLSPGDTSILGCAKALLEWHARHGFCGRCGARTAIVDGGWKRLCRSCGSEHFPRIDPVVIMLPVCGERCCLGRQARFPEGMYSAFAGFVEPGESLEEACARELHEETGLRTVAVTPHSSQPWPFPASLMIGMLAEVADAALTLDQEEITAAMWLDREEARLALAGALMRGGERVWTPPPLAIAHQLLKSWAEGG